MRLVKIMIPLCLMALAGSELLGCSQAPSPATATVAAYSQIPAGTPAITVTIMPSATPLPASEPTTAAMTAAATTADPAPTAGTTAKPVPRESEDRLALNDHFYAVKLDQALKDRITGLSYPADASGCKLSYDDLRYIKLLYVDFSGVTHDGELIVHAKLAQEVMTIFHELYQAGYPLASVRLVDDFGEPGDDNLSMAANNTSAFNYRFVSGTNTLSRHSYGAAVDINPLFNPYIVGNRVAPPGGADYVDRTRDFSGKIDHDDLCYKLFRKYGWSWGGDWSGDKDYQHFSKKLA